MRADITTVVMVVSLSAYLCARSAESYARRNGRKHRQSTLHRDWILRSLTPLPSKRQPDYGLSFTPYVQTVECCPSITEAIQPMGGVSITGRILELYREPNATQQFYQTSCREKVKGKPCLYIRSKYQSRSRCVQSYSYMYALVREFQSSGPWRLDYIRYRSGCTCQIQRLKNMGPREVVVPF